MRCVTSFALAVVMTLLLAFAGCRPKGEPPPAPAGKNYVPEFLAVWKLLAERQGVTLGGPVSADVQGPNLIHFQFFQEEGSSILNSQKCATTVAFLSAIAGARTDLVRLEQIPSTLSGGQ